MKFEMMVRNKGDDMDTAWGEEIDDAFVMNLEEAEAQCRAIIDRFNASLQSHEREREFISVEIVSEESDEHAWHKTNLVTITGPGSMSHDTYQCENCGVTGKRYGLSRHTTLDPTYKAPSYASCIKAKVLMERRAQRKRDRSTET